MSSPMGCVENAAFACLAQGWTSRRQHCRLPTLNKSELSWMLVQNVMILVFWRAWHLASLHLGSRLENGRPTILYSVAWTRSTSTCLLKRSTRNAPKRATPGARQLCLPNLPGLRRNVHIRHGQAPVAQAAEALVRGLGEEGILDVHHEDFLVQYFLE